MVSMLIINKCIFFAITSKHKKQMYIIDIVHVLGALSIILLLPVHGQNLWCDCEHVIFEHVIFEHIIFEHVIFEHVIFEHVFFDSLWVWRFKSITRLLLSLL